MSPAGRVAAEVETEIEDNGDIEDQPTMRLAPAEVEEDLDAEEPPGSSGGYVQDGSKDTADYALPEKNKEVWKNFGCDTEAGRMLRKLYKAGGAKDAASKVSYPKLASPASRWEPAPRAKPAAPKAVVRYPRAAYPKRDMDDPKNWPAAPIPCRRPAQDIFAELEAEQARIRRAGAPVDLPKGRDQTAEKQGLQDRFHFCGGRAMPPGAMGHVPAGALPPTGGAARAAAGREDRKRIDENGFNAEQREIFQELISAVQRKQARIAEIDQEEAKDPRPSKAKTARNKEALELKNEVDRDLKDIDKLLQLTEG